MMKFRLFWQNLDSTIKKVLTCDEYLLEKYATKDTAEGLYDLPRGYTTQLGKAKCGVFLFFTIY